MRWEGVAEAAQTAVTVIAAPRWGTTLDWAITLTLVVSALILIGILGSWLLYRGRQTEGQALWVHLLALGVFPCFLLAVGNFAAVEYSTEVSFCASCHLTMRPYIEDLHDARGTSLAAAHFLDRFAPGVECYACHADYGMHGAFKAKAIGLRHVYKYWTRTYRLPIRMTPPYDNRLCLKCHDGAKRFRAQAIHLDEAGQQAAPEFLDGQTDCIQCHGPAHAVGKGRTAATAREAG